MICPKCGSDVPSAFHFCGMCGEPLPPSEVPAAVEPASEPVAAFDDLTTPAAELRPVALRSDHYGREERAPEPSDAPPPQAPRAIHEPGISGPSFLGLGEDQPEPNDSYSYLLDEPPRRHRAGGLILVALIALLGAVVWLKWSPINHYLASLRQPPAAAYPNAADHPDTGLASDAKPPEHAPVPPQQQVAGTGTASGTQPQMIVEEPKKQSSDLPQHAADEPAPAPESSKPAPPAAKPQPTPSQPKASPYASADDEDAAAASKPAPPRRVAEKSKEVPGARTLALGENYLYGRGVARNCDQAVVYFKAAATAGNPEARSHLGALYSTGECVPRDRVAAYHWFTLARRAEPANPWLESNLNNLWRDMSPDERRRVGAER